MGIAQQRSIMGSVRFLSLGCVVLLLAACGGGGGGGGSRTVGNFTISTNAVTFDAEVGGPSPATATVTGSITGVDGTVFLTVMLTSNGIANASVAVTGETTGALTIFPKHPAQLGAGTFNDTVTVSACLDAGCARPVGGSPKTINVTYNVRGLGASPANVVLSAPEGVAAAAQQISLSNNTGSNWTSSPWPCSRPSRRPCAPSKTLRPPRYSMLALSRQLLTPAAGRPPSPSPCT